MIGMTHIRISCIIPTMSETVNFSPLSRFSGSVWMFGTAGILLRRVVLLTRCSLRHGFGRERSYSPYLWSGTSHLQWQSTLKSATVSIRIGALHNGQRGSGDPGSKPVCPSARDDSIKAETRKVCGDPCPRDSRRHGLYLDPRPPCGGAPEKRQ